MSNMDVRYIETEDRKRGPYKEAPLSRIASVRITAQQWALLKLACSREKKTLTQWMRGVILKKINAPGGEE